MKILIIQQKMIGDVLTSSLLFEALKRKFPDAELHYLIKEHTVAVVQNNPYIDKIIFDKQDASGNSLSLWAFMNYLKKQHYDAVVDVYSKIGSALLTYASRAALRVGREKWYTFFLYTKTISYDSTKPSPAGKAIQFRMDLLKPLGVDNDDTLRSKIRLSPRELEDARLYMEKSGVAMDEKKIMCSVMGSSLHKTYPLTYFATVLETVVQTTRAQLLFNYLPGQKDAVQNLLKNCSAAVRKRVIIDCYATNLRQFIAITSYCNALIGNEGGAVHMAKAVGIPTFAIFSPQITKEAWAADGLNEVAVHLRDYKPELFKDLNGRKEILQCSASLYEDFKPEFFESKLKKFLQATIN